MENYSLLKPDDGRRRAFLRTSHITKLLLLHFAVAGVKKEIAVFIKLTARKIFRGHLCSPLRQECNIERLYLKTDAEHCVNPMWDLRPQSAPSLAELRPTANGDILWRRVDVPYTVLNGS
ncbi:hypothetical protein EVAR_31203_1 [Eumeta japonica]|uniref:Uncharacterized protein n=1 Tax=Eumeta variegata TaxID=151549 RepID=A0A4C1VYJ7_EUMVA|nr:hypothetical protein EVAR_31203_1 [Eumeta japonica]